MSLFTELYIAVSILFSVVNEFIGFKVFRSNEKKRRLFGCTCFMAAVVVLAYLGSAVSVKPMVVSCLSSAYFLSIDIMLLMLLFYTIEFADFAKSFCMKLVKKLCYIYLIFEIVVFTVNIFTEWAVSYKASSEFSAGYTYLMKPLYHMHLAYTYLMVLIIILMFIYRITKVPREYKSKYIACVLCILVVVGINAGFLYFHNSSITTSIDWSVFAYSIGLLLLYITNYGHVQNRYKQNFNSAIFSAVDQALVLFDYDDKLFMHNEKLKSIVPEKATQLGIYVNVFLDTCGLDITKFRNEDVSTKCYIRKNGGIIPVKCDYKILKNNHDETIGKLFVLSNDNVATDLLTGFHTWGQFRTDAAQSPEFFKDMTCVAAVDINNLGTINNTRGKDEGDRLIQALAEKMKAIFPKETYFVRGEEAVLIAVCYKAITDNIRYYLKRLKNEFPKSIQYACAMIAENTDILVAADSAIKGMKAKKLIDRKSNRSQLLSSLMSALKECDADTEEHVKRTQRLGFKLGMVIGLSDTELSQLSLLCMLHDIGKIGVPLEILNKPGKLTEEELEIIHLHSNKGYQIAKSSREFEAIAEMILHHHERWDGHGYPSGLSKESIPKLSRVIAIIDAYDAMTHDRPYKKAMSQAEAKAELKACANTQFDPYIVTEFLAMIADSDDTKEEEVKNIPRVNDDYGIAAVQNITENVHPVQFSTYIIDANNRIVKVDDKFRELTGYSEEDIKNNEIHQIDLLPEEDRSEYSYKVRTQLAKNTIAYVEHRLQRKDDRNIYVFCLGKVFFDSVAREYRTEITISNVTNTYSVQVVTDRERARSQQRLKYWEDAYRRDSLTQLFNHDAFRNDIEAVLLEGNKKALMLMLDIDHFKEYNDEFGHQAGDEYLIMLAQNLKDTLRDEDLACRMGGDEFAAAIYFPIDCPESVIIRRATEIYDHISMILSDNYIRGSISMGAAVSSEEINTFKLLYQKSDNALYKAKESGRGQLVIG